MTPRHLCAIGLSLMASALLLASAVAARSIGEAAFQQIISSASIQERAWSSRIWYTLEAKLVEKSEHDPGLEPFLP